jgi:hypothetical protein
MGLFGNSGKRWDKNRRPSIETVAMTGVSIDSDYVYYLGDDGHVWRKRIGTGQHEMVCSAGVSKEDGYLYFIDTKGGNVCRLPKWGNFDRLDDLENKSLSKTNPLPTSEELEKSRIERAILIAKEREEYYDYDGAIEIYENLIMPEEAGRVRKLKAEQGAVKVDQTVIHGNYVDDRDTIVKDSVVNKSNIGSTDDDKFTKLKELTEMKKEGLIDDAEFKQMKKEILGK